MIANHFPFKPRSNCVHPTTTIVAELAVASVADELGIYISHIGGYSRKKYPNSIHWHFKENPKEIGCLDATFWEEGNEFWIVVRNYEPRWVTKRAKQMQRLLNEVL